AKGCRAALLYRVTGILLQIRIGDQLVRRDRIEIEVGIGRDAGGIRAVGIRALPSPDVAAAGEEAIPHQVGAAVRLPYQLTPPLVKNGLQREPGVRDTVQRIAEGP